MAVVLWFEIRQTNGFKLKHTCKDYFNCPDTLTNKLTGVLQVKIIEKRHFET